MIACGESGATAWYADGRLAASAQKTRRTLDGPLTIGGSPTAVEGVQIARDDTGDAALVARMAGAITETGYKGWIVLETSSPSKDGVADAKRNADYVRSLFGTQPG